MHGAGNQGDLGPRFRASPSQSVSHFSRAVITEKAHRINCFNRWARRNHDFFVVQLPTGKAALECLQYLSRFEQPPGTYITTGLLALVWANNLNASLCQ